MLYARMGKLPPKRHTQFRKPDGGLYYEEVLGSHGFSGPYSIAYHCALPTAALHVQADGGPALEAWNVAEHRQHHLRTKDAPAGRDPFLERVPLLFNEDVTISICRPSGSSRTFYRNGEADELYFVHEGSGELTTPLGTLSFDAGDYVLVPRGLAQSIRLAGPARLLIIEGRGAIEVPARYRNAYGQLLEHAPYAQRDIRLPERLETNDESGEFPVLVKAGGTLTSYLYGSHPFDVVGWDGYFYPWALNVADLEPLTGRVHQPPPAHQTFQGANFVVCTFVPRMLDYHPQAVPAPYSHSNVDSDEVLYYASGNFTSRTNVEAGSITLHRHGLPHGPQPGATEASLGAKSTDELAVMVDTFWPLRLATAARQLDDPTYPLSWSKKRP